MDTEPGQKVSLPSFLNLYGRERDHSHRALMRCSHLCSNANSGMYARGETGARYTREPRLWGPQDRSEPLTQHCCHTGCVREPFPRARVSVEGESAATPLPLGLRGRREGGMSSWPPAQVLADWLLLPWVFGSSLWLPQPAFQETLRPVPASGNQSSALAQGLGGTPVFSLLPREPVVTGGFV